MFFTKKPKTYEKIRNIKKLICLTRLKEDIRVRRGGMGPNGMRRDRTGREGTRDGTSRDGAGRDDTGRDGTGPDPSRLFYAFLRFLILSKKYFLLN